MDSTQLAPNSEAEVFFLKKLHQQVQKQIQSRHIRQDRINLTIEPPNCKRLIGIFGGRACNTDPIQKKNSRSQSHNYHLLNSFTPFSSHQKMIKIKLDRMPSVFSVCTKIFRLARTLICVLEIRCPAICTTHCCTIMHRECEKSVTFQLNCLLAIRTE